MCHHAYTHFICGCIATETHQCPKCANVLHVLFCDDYTTYRLEVAQVCGRLHVLG